MGSEYMAQHNMEYKTEVWREHRAWAWSQPADSFPASRRWKCYRNKIHAGIVIQVYSAIATLC